MRLLPLIIALTASIASVVGCSKPRLPPAQSALAFDPKLVLKWPGTPEESRQILPDDAGDLKIYSAMLTEKRAEGVVIFLAIVQEWPAKRLLGNDPQAMLTATVFAFQNEETNRKEVEFGPKKYPGLDIATRSVTGSSKPIIGRRLVVIAGPRIYHLSVSGTNEGLMQDPEVTSFFDSFDIHD